MIKWLPEERETVLRFDYMDKKWIIYTNIQKHRNKFKKSGFTLINELIEKEDGKERFIDAEFECPPPFISFRSLLKYNNKLNKEEDEEDEDILSDDEDE